MRRNTRGNPRAPVWSRSRNSTAPLATRARPRLRKKPTPPRSARRQKRSPSRFSRWRVRRSRWRQRSRTRRALPGRSNSGSRTWWWPPTHWRATPLARAQCSRAFAWMPLSRLKGLRWSTLRKKQRCRYPPLPQQQLEPDCVAARCTKQPGSLCFLSPRHPVPDSLELGTLIRVLLDDVVQQLLGRVIVDDCRFRGEPLAVAHVRRCVEQQLVPEHDIRLVVQHAHGDEPLT